MNKIISIIGAGFFGYFVGFGMQTNVWGYIGIGSFFMFGLLIVKICKDVDKKEEK